jgi:hypothetical protein
MYVPKYQLPKSQKYVIKKNKDLLSQASKSVVQETTSEKRLFRLSQLKNGFQFPKKDRMNESLD